MIYAIKILIYQLTQKITPKPTNGIDLDINYLLNYVASRNRQINQDPS